MLNNIDSKNIKKSAKTLNEILKKENVELTHSQTLEIISQAMGFKDWNTCSAISKKQDKLKKNDFDTNPNYTITNRNSFLENNNEKIYVIFLGERYLNELEKLKTRLLEIYPNLKNEFIIYSEKDCSLINDNDTILIINDLTDILSHRVNSTNFFEHIKCINIQYNGHYLLKKFFINNILYNKSEYPLDICYYEKILTIKNLETAEKLKHIDSNIYLNNTIRNAYYLKNLLNSYVDKIFFSRSSTYYYSNEYIVGESMYNNNELTNFLLENCFFSNDKKTFGFPPGTLFSNKSMVFRTMII